MTTVDLSPNAVAAIADAVVEKLRGERLAPASMLTVAQVAEQFGVSPDTVYAHAKAWGGVKVGTGPKAHWRFDADHVRAALAPQPAPSPAPASSRRRPVGGSSAAAVELLPVRGRAA